jgi:hypothetical protein
MASKYDKLKARMRNMREGTERATKNLLHAGETLAAGSVGAYAEGRLGDANGNWGFRNVPYLYMGGAAMYLTGLFAGDRYSSDLFAVGTGLIGARLFRTMNDAGVDAKANRTTGVPRRMNARAYAPPAMPAQPQRVPFGTAFDNIGVPQS